MPTALRQARCGIGEEELGTVMQGGVRAAVDIGGTFTDIVVMSGDGVLHESKISTTPDDPSRAVVAGLQALLAELGDRRRARRGGAARHHGRLQHHPAAVGRQDRADHHARLPRRAGDRPHPHARHVRPHLGQAASRWCRAGIGWRSPSASPPTAASSSRSTRRACVAAGEQLAAEGIEAVAICLINSYRNPAHEQRVEAILRERFPQLLVTASYAVLPETQGIRAHQHHGGERLPAGRHARLSAQPRERPALDRHRRADPRDDLQRRHAGGRQPPARGRCSWSPRARPAA